MEPQKEAIQRERLIRKLNKKLQRKTRELTDANKQLNVDHERFRNIWAGVQSIALVGAVIVGGIWTVYTVSTGRQLELAQIQYQSAQLQYDKIAFEAQKRTTVSVGLKATQLTFPNKGRRLIRLDLLLTRGGNWTPDDSWVDLANIDFKIHQITKVERNGTMWMVKEPWSLKITHRPDHAVVEAGETQTYEALQTLPEAGMYVADVTVPSIFNTKETKLATHALFVVK